MTHQRLQLVALSIIFAVITVMVVLMWWPYLTLLAMGAILAILFQPVYKNIAKKTKREAFAAWLTIILILLIVILPLYFVGQTLFNELVALYNRYRSGGINWSASEFVQNLPPSLRGVAENFSSDIGNRFSGFAANAFASVTHLLSNVAGFFLAFFLVFFTVYYLLRDGDNIKKYLGSIFPLSAAHENLLITKLERAVNGVVKGMFLVALIQGIVATVGFFIFGVPQPLLWGLLTFIAALVPTVGTSLAIIPAVIYLFVTGHVGAAIGMLIWGATAVGLIDNVISPRLIGSRVDIHPLLVLFSVLGGIGFFGILGFLLGPILMAIFVTLLNIYRTDLKEYLGK
jgi:predicted PurR-regulated permease PerM